MPFYRKTKPNKKGEHLIMFHFNFHRRRFKMSTGKSILPQDWDEKKNWPKRNFKYYPQYNALMLRLEEAVHNAYHELTITHIPTIQELGQAVEDRLKPDNSQNLYGYCLAFVENRKANYKLGSIQIYQRTAEHVGKFDQFATFDKISWDWIDRFKTYLYNLEYEQNTASKIYSTLKTILNDATGKGVNKNLQYSTKRGVIPRASTTKIFLTEDEIYKLYKTKMPNPEKEAARDAFVLQCYTGTRFSDIHKINAKSFSEAKTYFRITDKKNNWTVDIPAHHFVIEILEKWNWNLPKVSGQKYNVHLKEICKLAGITQEIVVTSFPGGVRKDKLVPKYDLVSSHVGRRSMICNMYIANIPVETIKKISGHRSHESFMTYLRLTPQDHLSVAFKSSFFKNKKLKVI